MASERIEFPGSAGTPLAARLDLPERAAPHAYAVFAHCFTCSKDTKAPVAIGRALTAGGIGTLRFDFTGLGGSAGDFGNTTFSSNVEDLLHAARWLDDRFAAPLAFIGHSLGGAAVLRAAARHAGCRAVVTIGAPFEPAHVLHHLGDALPDIERAGVAEVTLAGRSFNIRHDFVRDLTQQDPRAAVASLHKPLLVMHAPLDDTVPLDDARRIFESARHPKSFIALDGADHLLSKSADGEYAGRLIAAWASRYLTV